MTYYAIEHANVLASIQEASIEHVKPSFVIGFSDDVLVKNSQFTFSKIKSS